MVGKLLTQERLTELLNSGKVSLDASYLGEMGQLSRVAPSVLDALSRHSSAPG